MSEESAKAIGRLDVLAELGRMSASAAKSAARILVFGVLPAVALGAVMFAFILWWADVVAQLAAVDIQVLIPPVVETAVAWIARAVGTLILLGLGIRVWRTAKTRVQEREA